MEDYISFAKWSQSKDLERYRSYKQGEEIGDKELDMRILSLLEGLGYPIEKIGTYLYKELISYIYDDVKESIKSGIEPKELMEELIYPYSGLYHEIAREYLEIGVKPFHKYIKESIEEKDSSKAIEPLSITIKGLEEGYIDYGIQAMFLASYIYGKYDKKIEKAKRKTKKISESA